MPASTPSPTSQVHAPTTRVPCYEALAADLKASDIGAVFGLMSDDTALFVTTLDSMGLRFYGARHENNAIAMAEGYAAATGRLGIAILGRGPATANALHGAVYAARTGSKVLLIFGSQAIAAGAPNGLGPDGKAFNAREVFEASGIRSFVAADAASARRTLADAVGAARAGACVALLLPTNVQAAPVEFAGPQPIPVAPARPAQRARAAALGAAAALLQASRKPLFIAGQGAWRAGARDALVTLAEHTGAVLATTLKGKDMFRGAAYNLGVVGSFSHGAARSLIEQADCIVAFGAGLNQRTTSYGTSLPPNVPLIQVDALRSHIGRWYP
jgi:acetolactate synthase I/II/III large subunit